MCLSVCVFGCQEENINSYRSDTGTDMASLAAADEPGASPVYIPLADALAPASIFAPDRGGCGDDAGDESFEDEDLINGVPEDRGVDFTNKVN